MAHGLNPEPAQPSDRTLAWAVFCLLLAVYLATFSGLPENPDAEVEFQTTSALARRHSFALGGTSEADAIVGVIHQGRQGFNVRRGGPGREQEYFSWSGVGQPIAALPLYAAGALVGRLLPELEARHRATTHLGVALSEYCEHLFVGLRNPLLGALTGALVFLAARRVGARRRFALASALSYGLCSYAWPQARGTLSDVQATAALFGAFVLGESALEDLLRARAPRLLYLFGFGFALGLAFLTRPVLAPGVAVLALYFFVRAAGAARAGARALPWRELLAALGPALLCFAFFLWTNQRRFGDPFEAGYGGVAGLDWFLRSPWPGLVGVTVSPSVGLVWLAPGILLVGPWFVDALRGFPREAGGERARPALVAGLLLAVGVPHVLIPSWYGAWSYGPRYILPLIPFLWFPLGVVLERTRGSAARILVALLFLLGGATALGGVLVEYTTNLDLTVQASRLAWPAPPGSASTPAAELVQDDERFVRAKFDWRFAAPWAHWRILFHRLRGAGESYSVRELYFLDSDAQVTPQWERGHGFLHFAWVDLRARLRGPRWPGPVLCSALLVLSGVFFSRARRNSTA
jgi:hypothetical protein